MPPIPEPGSAGQPPSAPPKLGFHMDPETLKKALEKELGPRDPALGFHRNWEEKRASDERLGKIVENQRKAV